MATAKPVKPAKAVKVVASDAVVDATNNEWAKIRAKIEKSLSNRKKLPLKKGEVKAFVRASVREVIG